MQSAPLPPPPCLRPVILILGDSALFSLKAGKMNILVTGATGFIGARTANHLLEQGHAVSGNGRSAQPADILSPEVQYLRGSLNDADVCKRITSGVDIIVHCAGKAGTWGSYQSYYEANVSALEKLLDAAAANGVQRLVNISSPSIYFNFRDHLQIPESYVPPRFSNAYAETKFLAEKLAHSRHGSHLQVISLRPRLVIGAGDNNVLPRLIRLQQEGKLKQIGNGQNIVTVTTIGNLLHAIDRCIAVPAEATGQVYNIGNEEPVRFWSFVNDVLGAFGLEPVTTRVPYRLAMALARANQFLAKLTGTRKEPALLPVPVAVLATSMTLDLSRAKSQLGYKPQHTAADGIKEFSDWWKKVRH